MPKFLRPAHAALNVREVHVVASSELQTSFSSLNFTAAPPCPPVRQPICYQTHLSSHSLLLTRGRVCSPPLTLLRSVCLCVRRTGNYDFAVKRHAAHIAAPWKLGSGGDLSPRRVDVAGQADIVCFLFPRRPLIPLRDGARHAVSFVSGLRSKRKPGTEQARTLASRLCRTHLPRCGQHTAHVDAHCRSDACVSPRHPFVENRERVHQQAELCSWQKSTLLERRCLTRREHAGVYAL